ncbi:MAG: CDP-diacylglycerol--glycerol-3-phosphate 3-phosphatidyltransferase [Bdellovibrionales bacterium GWB1_55_8]|nr:MAG: CDP-diacylglycerol--glycerol-3-phosphate 3-phosphatidyltransferase [Bdellovibrionales bacterium GWB1_55_8]
MDELTFRTTPNFITLARIAFVPVVVGLLFLNDPIWDLVAALTFGIASFTDYLDGYIARKSKTITVYGKLLDPLADKFLVVSSLVMLQHLGRIHVVIVILLICRELAITGLRALASAEGVIIPASSSAKWKTATQMVAIPLLMVKTDLLGIPFFSIGTALIYISLAISLWSARDYVADFFVGMKEKRRIALEKKKTREKRFGSKWGKKRHSSKTESTDGTQIQ